MRGVPLLQGQEGLLRGHEADPGFGLANDEIHEMQRMREGLEGLIHLLFTITN